jgi:Uma2 family endonuclease
MSTKRAKSSATYQDVIDAPPHRVAEIVDGELRLSPRPRTRHARSSSRLGAILDGPFDRGVAGPGGWLILDEPELHIPEVVVPDLAGWRRERMIELPDVPYLELAPDWACEVLSPATADFDRTNKLPVYARARVSHAWLVDPAIRTLEVLRLDGSAWRLVGTWKGDAKVRAEPLDATEVDLSLLWQR